jgi:hypothetical protein
VGHRLGHPFPGLLLSHLWDVPRLVGHQGFCCPICLGTSRNILGCPSFGGGQAFAILPVSGHPRMSWDDLCLVGNPWSQAFAVRDILGYPCCPICRVSQDVL